MYGRCNSTQWRSAAEAAHRLDLAAVRLDLAGAFGGVPAEQGREMIGDSVQAVERANLKVDTVFAMHQGPMPWNQVVALIEKSR